eukprot:INCI18368.1.p2 GENE.INCI18368.1~~INCI18368.1.p2  ORF type:complete len:209 (-),score=65.56 INCI18368.1:1186-1812(-)
MADAQNLASEPAAATTAAAAAAAEPLVAAQAEEEQQQQQPEEAGEEEGGQEEEQQEEQEETSGGGGGAKSSKKDKKKEKKEKKKDKKDKKKDKRDKKDGGDAPTGPRFVVKKWNACAMWSWDICTDTCAICRNKLTEPSIEYQANPQAESSGLHIAWGECGHVFHHDCIQRWNKTRHTCPLCNTDWKLAKVESMDNTVEDTTTSSSKP